MALTCRYCLDKLSTMGDAAEARAYGYMDPITGMRAGNRAPDEMGHAIYWTTRGA